MSTVTWRELLDAMSAHYNEPIISCTLTEEELDQSFYSGSGGTEGAPFTAWSENRVFFPVCYDGEEWVGSAPRHPCNEACGHKGG